MFLGWPVFFRYLTIQGTMAKPFEATLLEGYTIAIISALAPGQHMWLSLGPGPKSQCSKKVGNLMFMLSFKSLSARDRH